MPKRYPAEFRARSVELIRAGRSVREVALLLGVSEQALYGWRRQDRIDRGEVPDVSTVELAELAAAKRRIRELEVEIAIHRRTAELLKEAVPPKGVLRRSV
jgi:transposase-like protein